MSMMIELLYFEGCPGTGIAGTALRQALAEEGIEARVESVRVETDAEAGRRRFPGSPTIRLDGEDLFPVQDQERWALSCRTYATPEGLRKAPSVSMLRAALTRRIRGPQRP